jgi:hypothetical protein
MVFAFTSLAKASTEESTRLMAAVLQQQLREVEIALDIRTFEFATFFPTSPTGCSSFILCDGSVATRILTFSNTCSIPPSSS